MSVMVRFDIESQLNEILVKNENFEQIKETNRKARNKNTDVISNATDANLYQEMVKKISLDKLIVSFNLNTDGCPLVKSKNYSLWPLLGTILELDQSNRESFKNAIIFGFWLNLEKPLYDIFFQFATNNLRELLNKQTLKIKITHRSKVNLLNLSLIKLPVLDKAILSLNYTSTIVPLNNSSVGLGCSLSQEFIFADFKSNKFAHQFYLITKSSTTLLNMDKIENDQILFKIENDKDQNIKYIIKESSIDYSILSYLTKSKSKLILFILTQEDTKFGVEIRTSEAYNYKILSFPKHFVIYLLDSKSNENLVYLCKIQSLRKEYENSKIEVDISDKLKLVNDIKFNINDMCPLAQNEKYVVGFEKQEKTFDFKNGNKVYKRTYKLENQDILTTIVDHHGYDVEIKDNKKSVKDDFKDAFLIDIESFYLSLTPNRISCKENLFDLNSQSWTIQLDSYELYSNDKLELDFKTDCLDDIQVSYPYYIAYMSDSDKSVKILPFENDTIGKEDIDSLTFKLTIPTQSIIYVGITENTITLDKQKYRKTYEYDDESSSLQNGVVLYSKFKTIPAGDSTKHGYIQYDFSTEIKYFNSDGKVIKIDKETTDNKKDKIENHQENLDQKQSVLYAKDGTSEIVDFYNLVIKIDEADYIGFEVYEKSNN
ncbi:unnamed protein product [Brachionus calyciflorus]|uniref:Uncharacterized protein n=1 Tax=Brachionus calyciflorus TaxID=104777 RepID=A0A814J394_9BILA|nr:unnamed protein product [Brachionus calyciflorus]